MTAFIIKSSLSLILLYGLYWLLLRKEKFFVFNRYFLILAIIFSLVIPFVSLPDNIFSKENYGSISLLTAKSQFNINEELFIAAPDSNQSLPLKRPAEQAANYLTYISLLAVALYVVGASIFLIRFLNNIRTIIRSGRNETNTTYLGHMLVLVDEKVNPHCFMNRIFVNRTDFNENRINDKLLAHEAEHIRQSHSIDILIIELIRIFYWFNPVLILFNRAIRENHEYLADSGVLKDSGDISDYADKLISFISTRRNVPLTSGFNPSLTKKRLVMISKSKPATSVKRLKIILTMNLTILFFFLISIIPSSSLPLNNTFPVIDLSVLRSDTKTNSALASNIETFQSETNQKLIKGIILNEEGKPLRNASIVCMVSENVSSGMTAGADGRFEIDNVKPGYTLKIGCWGYLTQTIKPDFTSDMIITLKKNPMTPEVKEILFRKTDFTPSGAIVSINGKILESKDHLIVNPREIESFKILNAKEATGIYGNKGKNGVLEIFLSGYKAGAAGKKRSNGIVSDTSKYITLISVNYAGNRGGLIDIPVTNLQSAAIWNYTDTPSKNKKELRSISIMTRDFYKIKGIIVDKNEKPLPGV